MYLPLLCLLLILQPVYNMRMPLLSCGYYWEPNTYMEADVNLTTFIPISIPLDLPPNVRNPFDKEPSELWNADLTKWKNYQILLTVYFAIEEINKDKQLLPNITMGFHVYNSFNSNKRTLEGPLMFLSGRSDYIPNYKCKTKHKVLGIISGTRPEFSAAIGTLLGLYKVPQVTYGPFNAELSDKVTFPSLYQMSPKERGLTHGVIPLLLYFGWNWVGLFVVDYLNGKEFLSHLKAEMATEDICEAFTQKIPAYWKLGLKYVADLVDLNQYTQVNVQVFYGDIDALLIFCLDNRIFLARGKVWFMAKQHLIHLDSAADEHYLIYFFRGSVSFSKKRTIPGFKNFLEHLTPSQYPEDIYFSKFWVDNFSCSLPALPCKNLIPCSANISLKINHEKIDLMTISEPSYSIWNSVYSVAHALHKALLSKTEMGSMEDRNTDWLLPWQLHPFLRKIKVMNDAGDEISFNENKKIMETYDIQNFVEHTQHISLLVKVGEFVFKSPQDQGFFINEVLIKWPSNFNQ
ncbi:vomeronasal type-2 receptor 26-like, partial [Psammomys obesus]|uniref:vomeronasal type-2 receptor 26-like n=1 Tax=Psammomys obesus TaxID=48139 RepID=UPI002452837F